MAIKRIVESCFIVCLKELKETNGRINEIFSIFAILDNQLHEE